MARTHSFRAAIATIYTVLVFPPVLMALLAVALAQLTVRLDQSGALRNDVSDNLLFAESAAAATTLLSVITGALIGTLSTLFSVTLATLTFASSQFGPRLLALFLQDRRTHVTIGTLLGTFVYSIAVLRAVGNVDQAPFVPRFAVSVAMILVAASLGMILYFSSFLSQLIQAPGLIAAVSRGVTRCCQKLYPSGIGYGRGERVPDTAVPQPDLPTNFEAEAATVAFTGRGYIQWIDEARVMRLAVARDVVLRLLCCPGDYVMPGRAIARAWPPRRVDQALGQELNDQFRLGWRRTHDQDITCQINQLVEIAVRALSPGINDPFTTTQCIDRLADELVVFAGLKFPGTHRYDASGCLRIVTAPLPSFAQLTSTCFDAIRQYGRSSVPVCTHLADTFGALESLLEEPEHRAAVRRQVLLLQETARVGLTVESDRALVLERAASVLARFEESDSAADLPSSRITEIIGRTAH